MFKHVAHVFREYKILRGMVSYAVLWPVGSLIEQTLVEKKNFQTYDWKKCLRFSLYGASIMGPIMYVWVSFAARLWPRTDFRTSIKKAITEQFTIDPTCIVTFMFVMSLLENKTIAEAKTEVENKFLDTYRVGVIYWPTMQTMNFTFVPVKNQVVCTSFFSMIWSAFLAYEKHIKSKPAEQQLTQQQQQQQESKN